MPEGDTIHRAANRLGSVLVGHPIVRMEVRRAAVPVPRPGTQVDAVDAVGKHLLIRFGDGTTLRTHMRMTGSWHLYRTGERWRMPSHLARAVVEIEGWTAVCFAAPVVELESVASGASQVAHLGPDLTRPDVTVDDIDRAVARMPDGEIGAVLLDQRMASGIGNIYKSETLFVCGVDPFARVADLDEATKHTLLSTASRLLRASVANAPRPRNVYGRAGQPCRKCGTPIRARRQGEQPRTTYWCPSCQK